MTITTKRARSVVLSASVAALGTAAACPAANAASGAAPVAQSPRAVVARGHATRRRRRPPRPATAAHGAYVYEVTVESTGAAQGKPNMTCAGAGARVTSVVFTEREGSNSFQLWERDPAAWNKTYSFTAAPATTITVSWTPPAERREAEADANHGEIRNPRLQGRDDTTTVGALCAATSAGASVAEIGRAVVTWRLPSPARSLSAFTATPPTNVKPLEYSNDFEVLPDGSVPPFAPFQY